MFDALLQVHHCIVVAVVGEIEALGQTIDRLAGARDRLPLGLGDDLHIGGEGGRVRIDLVTQFPGGSDDVLLQGDQRAALPALSAAASPTAATIGATELLVGRND